MAMSEEEKKKLEQSLLERVNKASPPVFSGQMDELRAKNAAAYTPPSTTPAEQEFLAQNPQLRGQGNWGMAAPAAPDASAEQLIAEKEGVVSPSTPASAGPEAPAKPEISTKTPPMDLVKLINSFAAEVKSKYPEREALGEGVDLTGDIADLKSALKELDKEKEGEQKEIAKRELYSNIASQIGKFAAAMYGMKNNVDMSGIAPEGPKFENEYARLLEKYKTSKQDLRDTGELSMADKRRAQDRRDKETSSINAYNQDKANFERTNNATAAGMKAQGAIEDARLKSDKEKALIAASKGAGTKENKELAEAIKADTRLREKIVETLNNKGDDKKKIASLRGLIGNKIPEEQWNQISTEPGLLFGRNPRTPEDLVTAISTILPSPTAAPVATTVTILHKDTGKTKQVPANSIEAQNAKNNPAFEVK